MRHGRLVLVFAVLFTGLCVTGGVLLGSRLDPLYWPNFHVILEIVAVTVMLLVSLTTYGRIMLFNFNNADAIQPATDKRAFGKHVFLQLFYPLWTAFSAMAAVASAAMPHLYIASLVSLLGSFCVFDLLTTLSFSDSRTSDSAKSVGSGGAAQVVPPPVVWLT